jgi:Winged helix DNA-binding domain
MRRKLTAERLNQIALGRQFPPIRGRGAAAVLGLFSRLGPIQSQVPKAPFLTVSSRLPGTAYETIADLFDTWQLIKTTSLRGTVHTTVADHYPWVNAVARRTWTGPANTRLRLSRTSITDVWDELERFAADWQQRAALVDHGRSWIAAHESTESAAIVDTGAGANYLWGHSGLLRRPADGRWERRTDTEHRAVRSFLDLPTVNPEAGLTELVRVHLGSYGPATRRDIAWWTGENLTLVDEAVERLDDELVRIESADGATYHDLAEPPRGGANPGLRLLPEYDGIFCGYAPPARERFMDLRHYDTVWLRANGIFSPVVLLDGRVVAVWRLTTRGSRTDLEIERLPGEHAVSEADVADQIRAMEAALEFTITDVRRA